MFLLKLMLMMGNVVIDVFIIFSLLGMVRWIWQKWLVFVQGKCGLLSSILWLLFVVVLLKVQLLELIGMLCSCRLWLSVVVLMVCGVMMVDVGVLFGGCVVMMFVSMVFVLVWMVFFLFISIMLVIVRGCIQLVLWQVFGWLVVGVFFRQWLQFVMQLCSSLCVLGDICVQFVCRLVLLNVFLKKVLVCVLGIGLNDIMIVLFGLNVFECLLLMVMI